MRMQRTGYKFILILILVFLLSQTASYACASTEQSEYSSSVAQLVIDAGKEDGLSSTPRKRGGQGKSV